MPPTSLKFGTSGLRGLAADLMGQPARRYVAAFLVHLATTGQRAGEEVLIGRDLRASSPAVLVDCVAAVAHAGLRAVDCGVLPTPALALEAMRRGAAAVMITGSHIPADRNGLKFYTAAGEIGKADEAGILGALGDEDVADASEPAADAALAVQQRYLQRLQGFLPEGALAGIRIGVFEHSTVAREVLSEALAAAGATVVPLGRTDAFVPVDTEAFADAIFAPLPGWLRQHRLDAIVSADGDGDRPLLMDGQGRFVRGDALGLLAARFLGAETVVTPVTSNSAIERTDYFAHVVRTRVGSPYVVAAMADGGDRTIGFEANGGTFTGSGFLVNGRPLAPLPTRDAVLPLLCALGIAAEAGRALDQVVADLPLKAAMADRLSDVPSSQSAAFLERLAADADFAARFFAPHEIAALSQIDGLRFELASGDTVHFRASGNAPELRCYVEAETPERAAALLDWAMRAAAAEVR